MPSFRVRLAIETTVLFAALAGCCLYFTRVPKAEARASEEVTWTGLRTGVGESFVIRLSYPPQVAGRSFPRRDCAGEFHSHPGIPASR